MEIGFSIAKYKDGFAIISVEMICTQIEINGVNYISDYKGFSGVVIFNSETVFTSSISSLEKVKKECKDFIENN